MPDKFTIVPNRSADGFREPNTFLGYRSKTDLTALPAGVLVSPSQNVLSNDADRIGIRAGYTVDGLESTAMTPIRSSYDWISSTGDERNVRLYDDELEYRYVAADGSVTWRRLKDGFSTSALLQFAEFWSPTEKIDLLLFVDGSTNLYEWSGAVGTIASVGANTLTLAGGGTWAQSRFLTSGTRSVVIKGVEYAYTGGESTNTLTGVTPDPAAASPAIAVGDVVHQAVRTYAFGTFSRPGTFANTDPKDLIAVLNNQVWLGYTKSRYVHLSKQSTFTDYTQSSPRAPAEGDTITLDGTASGFVAESNGSDQSQATMLTSAGRDFWYRTTYQLSSDFTKETAIVKRLLTAAGQAARSQDCIVRIKNRTAFISNEPTLDELGRVENIDTPQSKPISDPIKADFDEYDFTNAHTKYHRNFIYIALPAESLVLIYNLQKQWWEAPQVLPVRRFAIIGGELYGHSSQTAETYKLFDGTSDKSGFPIHAIAAFSYENGGNRYWQKEEDKHFSEGYISSNTVLSSVIKYDFGGFTSIVEQPIEGDDDDIIFATAADGSLGKNPLGSMPFGSITDSMSDLPKFRVIHDLLKQDYFERQVIYETNDVDQQWELLAFGSNATLSPNSPSEITK